jgi:uncharacterized protein with HEPN domain
MVLTRQAINKNLIIDEIDSFFIDYEKRFESYRSNNLLKRATERNLEIIGEAVNRILLIDPDFPIKNAKRIVGLRNQIIHSYDNISDENIWGIITNHLPNLKAEIAELTTSQNENKIPKEMKAKITALRKSLLQEVILMEKCKHMKLA